jgi:hypothetical protein
MSHSQINNAEPFNKGFVSLCFSVSLLIASLLCLYLLAIFFRSLHSEKSKRDRDRIMEENMAMLRRIDSQKSAYRSEKWREHEEQNSKLLNMLSRFPPERSGSGPVFFFSSVSIFHCFSRHLCCVCRYPACLFSFRFHVFRPSQCSSLFR